MSDFRDNLMTKNTQALTNTCINHIQFSLSKNILKFNFFWNHNISRSDFSLSNEMGSTLTATEPI